VVDALVYAVPQRFRRSGSWFPNSHRWLRILYKKAEGLTGNLTPEQISHSSRRRWRFVLPMRQYSNGLGRLFWAKISDNIGRQNGILIMFATQAVLYVLVAKGFVGPTGFFVNRLLLSFGVLRRWLRDHACLRCRRIRSCLYRQGIWIYAYGLEHCRSYRPLCVWNIQTSSTVHRSRSAYSWLFA